MGVKRYISVPTEVEALQFTENFDEVKKFTGDDKFRPVPEEMTHETDKSFGYEPDVVAEVYDTLHDTWVGVKHGQWIIKGTLNEFYPCAPAVFDAKYREKK